MSTAPNPTNPLQPQNKLPMRAQLAQRIQRELLREIDHDIQVDRLLDDGRYARDVLLVCDALTGGDLPTLAALFREACEPGPAAGASSAAGAADPSAASSFERQATQADRPLKAGTRPPARGGSVAPKPAHPAPGHRPGHAVQANEWGDDTSSFGVTHPPPLQPEPPPPAANRPERRRFWPWPRD